MTQMIEQLTFPSATPISKVWPSSCSKAYGLGQNGHAEEDNLQTAVVDDRGFSSGVGTADSLTALHVASP
ncbi:MAG TPA: hypothetical protein VGQ46_16530 [Thermoanaerobaculia bacterium]|jgi:hypothetical protein|nr:hypothetical protein [Thermoanaerobaculia bacterium]